MSMIKDLQEQLESVLMTMEDRGLQTYMVGMNRKEIELVRDLLMETGIVAPDKYEEIYQEGYEGGYKTAVMDIAKKIKELETYGGNKPEKRADGMPEHHARGAEDMQRKLQRAGAEAGNGGSLGAMPEESEHT